jgi:Tol biopolymer transport system component/formylglycine-generating enzyme required for sulfatase activity
MIVNADGTGLQNLTPDHFGTLPKFSPDGKLLLFRHRAERDQQQIDAVAVVNVDGTGFRIVAEELYSNGATFSVNEYDWSPDGRYIAYTNDHTGAPEIAIVGVDGTGNRIITNRVRDMGSVEPFWSPDGQLIMFSTGTLGTGYNNNLEIGGFAIGAALHINVMNADGTDVRQLTKMTSVPAAWSPDGRFILYRSYEDSFMRLRVMKRDGSDDREIIKGVDYDFSAMGDVAWLLTSSANQPAQAVVVVPPPPTRAPITETLPLDLASIQPVQRNSDWTPQIVKVDDVEMVVVPPGCFMMGEPDTRDQYRQAHQLCFDKAYLIDRFEVTNAVIDLFQFKPGHAAFNKLPNYPRENIDWYEASEFCRLRGGHLPTEAEWEYAARGPDGLEFANGNEENGVTSAANSGTQPMNRALRDRTWTNAVDMQGNVEEWTSSYYTQYPYNAQDGREDPSYTSNRVIRGIGGSLWYRAGAAASTDWGIHRGFRCARGETETTVGTFISSTTTPMPPEPTQPSAPAIEPTATPIIIVATAPVIDCPDTPPTQFVVGMRGTVLPFADGTARPVNVRDVPARSGEVVIKMGANTMFTIVGGPICADGFLWWQIAIDDGPTGWAAEGSMENYFLDPVARG